MNLQIIVQEDGESGIQFTDEARARLENARRLIDPEKLTTVYSTWENPWAKAGGLFAVADNIAEPMGRHGEFLLLSPRHCRLRTAPQPSDLKRIGTTEPVVVPFEGRDNEVRLFGPRDQTRCPHPWVLMEADGFFEADGGEGGTNPYVYSSRRDGWDDLLLRDSLFASTAAPRVLAGLGKKRDVVYHANDWEFSPMALTVKLALLDGVLESAVVVLTLHNLFSRPLPPAALQAITGGAGKR
jgi:glycogen synthase